MNKSGDDIRNGKKAFFSFLYMPGATNLQSWKLIKGNANKNPENMEILMWTMNPCCKPV